MKVTICSTFRTKTIENIGYIHLDVEGMEYKILQGSNKLLDECRPIISFEQHLELNKLKNKNQLGFSQSTIDTLNIVVASVPQGLFADDLD